MIQTDGIPRNQLDLHRDCSRRLLDSSKSEPTVCSEPASIPKLLSTKKPPAEVQKGPLHPTILLGDPFTSLQSRSHSLSQLMVWLPISPRRWKPPGELLSICFPVCRQALSFLLRSGDCTGEVSLSPLLQVPYELVSSPVSGMSPSYITSFLFPPKKC